MPGERGRLARHAFHQVAVAGEAPGPVVHDGVARAVEPVRQEPLGDRHAHGVADALAQRAGGRLRRPACGPARDGPASCEPHWRNCLSVVQREVVSGQVEQRVEQHGCVPATIPRPRRGRINSAGPSSCCARSRRARRRSCSCAPPARRTSNVHATTLADADASRADMRTLVIVGASTTRRVGRWVYTPRERAPMDVKPRQRCLGTSPRRRRPACRAARSSRPAGRARGPPRSWHRWRCRRRSWRP